MLDIPFTQQFLFQLSNFHRILLLKYKAGRTVKVRNSRYYDFVKALSSLNEAIWRRRAKYIKLDKHRPPKELISS